MTNNKHGGDLDFVENKYNIPKNELIDFSSNINPLGYPKKAMEELKNNLNISTTYPDKDYKNLKKAISEYTKGETANIVVGNGSTELISLFIQTVATKESIIISPSYSEYERELSVKGSKFKYFPLEEKDNFQLNLEKLIETLTKEIGLLIICNPNNPTGTVIETDTMEKILIHCKANNIAVMIDETYIEFTDNINKSTAIPLTSKYENLFVIRGTSKFFSMAGIRLGYGVCSYKKFLNLVTEHQNPWSVNHFASFLGERIFKDELFKNETKSLIVTERERIFKEINSWKNCKIYPSSANFLLVKIETADITSTLIYEKCLEKRMVIRNCSTFTYLDETYIRFCIMTKENNTLLLETLRNIIDPV